MAVENVGLDITLSAAGTLASKMYYFMKLSADNTVTVCTGATDTPIGILQNKPDAAGKAAVVRVVGYSKVSSDAGLTYGNLIGTSADGQADAKTSGTDTTEYICGQVVKGTSNAGELAEVFINCANIGRAA